MPTVPTKKTVLLLLSLAAGLIIPAVICISRMNEAIADHRKTLAELRATLSSQQETITAQARSLTDLRTEITRQNESRQETSARITDIIKKIDDTRTDLTQLTTDLSTARKDARDWQVEYVKTLVKMDAGLNDARNDIDRLNATAVATNARIDQIGIKDIQQQIIQIRQTIDTITRTLDPRKASEVNRTLHPDLFNNQ